MINSSVYLSDLFFFFHFAFSQLEKQIHEDEEFSRTLAMLDAEPQTKKVKGVGTKRHAHIVVKMYI